MTSSLGVENLTHSVYFVRGSTSFAKKYILDVSSSYRFIDLSYEKFGIDESRNLQSFLNQKRDIQDIFIVTVSQVTTEAQHSLLKILEDLENTTIFFVFPNEVRLIDTLLSRGYVLHEGVMSDKNTEAYVETFLNASLVKRQTLVEQKIKELENPELRKFLQDFIAVLSQKISKDHNSFSKLDREVLIHAQEFLSYPKISAKQVFEYMAVVLKK